jgi:uncharacterized membrane protein
MIMAYTKEEYYAVKEHAESMKLHLMNKLADAMHDVGDLQDEVEILRAERSHWYHMYNNNVDERPDI